MKARPCFVRCQLDCLARLATTTVPAWYDEGYDPVEMLCARIVAPAWLGLAWLGLATCFSPLVVICTVKPSFASLQSMGDLYNGVAVCWLPMQLLCV